MSILFEFVRINLDSIGKVSVEMNRIYFDNQSTTQLANDVIEAMTEVMRSGFANPASQHEFGRNARRKLESFRERIGKKLGLGRSDRCIFTSGGTESNNLALLGHFAGEFGPEANIISSAIEHPSVLAALDYLGRKDIEIRMVDARSTGTVDPVDFERLIDSNTQLVTCMLANNETGAVQPVERIASICKDHRIPFHVDAVQAIGKHPFSFSSLGCSSATVSPHKVHGPAGIGILLAREECLLDPLIFGGFQQEGIRPGTESIVLAAGACRAIESAIDNLEHNCSHMRQLRDRFESLLTDRFPFIEVNCARTERLPNASNLSFLGIDRQQFVLAADMAGLACSTGSACSSGSSQPSHVLASMGRSKESIHSAVRFGFSVQNQLEEVNIAVDKIDRILVAKKA